MSRVPASVREYNRGLRDGLELAATIAEQQDRSGREWVSNSLWANIIKRVPDAIRAHIQTLAK